MSYFKYFLLLVFFNFSIYSCIIIPVSDPNLKQKDLIDPEFKTGIIFYLGKSAPLIKNKLSIEIYEYNSFEFIKKQELEWNSVTSVSLPKGRYIVKTYVVYFFGNKIWKTKNQIDLINSNVRTFKFNQPIFVTSDPIIESY